MQRDEVLPVNIWLILLIIWLAPAVLITTLLLWDATRVTVARWRATRRAERPALQTIESEVQQQEQIEAAALSLSRTARGQEPERNGKRRLPDEPADRGFGETVRRNRVRGG